MRKVNSLLKGKVRPGPLMIRIVTRTLTGFDSAVAA